MSLLLLIDSALETATVGLARNGELIAERANTQRGDHASWIHPAIQELIDETEISVDELEAVGVSAGPGSYTGLRIGMATAKGICYAENIPLISVSSLQALAAGARDENTDLIIALIDARRDEVFAGAYDQTLNNILPDQAMILKADSFHEFNDGRRVALTGNGAAKTIEKLNTKNFFLRESKHPMKNLALLTYEKFRKKSFSDLAYHEPAYLKEFYSTAKERR